MSVYSLAVVGTVPLGNLLAGSLAQYISAPYTVILCGLVCLWEAVWFNRQLPILTNWIKLKTNANSDLSPVTTR